MPHCVANAPARRRLAPRERTRARERSSETLPSVFRPSRASRVVARVVARDVSPRRDRRVRAAANADAARRRARERERARVERRDATHFVRRARGIGGHRQATDAETRWERCDEGQSDVDARRGFPGRERERERERGLTTRERAMTQDRARWNES